MQSVSYLLQFNIFAKDNGVSVGKFCQGHCWSTAGDHGSTIQGLPQSYTDMRSILIWYGNVLCPVHTVSVLHAKVSS